MESVQILAGRRFSHRDGCGNFPHYSSPMTPSIWTDLKTSVALLSMGLLMNGTALAQTAQMLHKTPASVATHQPVATAVSAGASQRDLEARAAAAAQRDTDPHLNGSVRDAPQVRSAK